MNLIENAEKECAVLGTLFQGIVNEMKVSTNKSQVLIYICQIRRAMRKKAKPKNITSF